MATLRKRGNTWTAVVRLTGSPARYRTFPTKGEAQQWAAKIEQGIRSGDIDSAEASTLTFTGAVRQYLLYLPQRGYRTEEAMARTLDFWAGKNGNLLGRCALDKITTPMLGKIKDDWLQTLEPATVNRRLMTLSAFFKWACGERSLLRRNPVKGVSKPREPRGRVRYLSEDERVRLFDTCRSLQDYFYPLVVTACYTGMRQAELLSLTWDNVDLVEGWAHLEHTKNGERRRVPLRGPALEVLKEWRQRDRFSTGRVFGPTHFNSHRWGKVLKSACIDDLRFHDCRHTAASYLAMSGADLNSIATLLGHKTLAVTRRYTHLSDQHLGSAIEKMAAKFPTPA
jgi:integrase